MLNHKMIERLAKMVSKDYLITSFYLNVDRSQKNHDPKIVLKDLLKEKRAALNDPKNKERYTRDQLISVEEDLNKIEHYVLHEFVHKDIHNGLAIFSSSRAKFWEVISLVHPVTDYLGFDYDTYIRPLSEVASEYGRYAVVLVDSKKAKIFDVRQGFANPHLAIEDESQPKVKFGGQDGLQERNIDRQHDELVLKHLKHVAEETNKLFTQNEIQWLIIGGRQQIIGQFEPLLAHPLRKQIIGHMVVEPDASLNDILKKSAEVSRAARDTHETDLIAKLKNEAHAKGGKGIFGLQPTLQSLRRGGIHTLIVTKGFQSPGFVCHKCYFVGTPEEKNNGNQCPICAIDAHDVPDIVEEAITFAYMQGCVVENVSQNSRLKLMGNIGALLRY